MTQTDPVGGVQDRSAEVRDLGKNFGLSGEEGVTKSGGYEIFMLPLHAVQLNCSTHSTCLSQVW